MKITKHKTEKPGEWAIRVDGNPTPLTIVKGDDPKWGDYREWYLFNEFTLVMTQRRAGDTIPIIEELLAALGVGQDTQ